MVRNSEGEKMMSELKELLTLEDLETALEQSTEDPIFLFKQSTTCPISTEAFSEFNKFVETHGDDVNTYFVKVRETREVSNQIADETGVQHESPQVLFIQDREALWNTSHNEITIDSLEEALKTYA